MVVKGNEKDTRKSILRVQPEKEKRQSQHSFELESSHQRVPFASKQDRSSVAELSLDPPLSLLSKRIEAVPGVGFPPKKRKSQGQLNPKPPIQSTNN